MKMNLKVNLVALALTAISGATMAWSWGSPETATESTQTVPVLSADQYCMSTRAGYEWMEKYSFNADYPNGGVYPKCGGIDLFETWKRNWKAYPDAIVRFCPRGTTVINAEKYWPHGNCNWMSRHEMNR